MIMAFSVDVTAHQQVNEEIGTSEQARRDEYKQRKETWSQDKYGHSGWKVNESGCCMLNWAE